MIKLIENELIKIFKKKSFYLLLLIIIIIIALFNYANPDQNKIFFRPLDFNIDALERAFENMDKNDKFYVSQKLSIEFGKLYNSYSENSWQKYALGEENTSHDVQDFPTNFYQDIKSNLTTIIDYEINPNSNIQKSDYEEAQKIYKQYVQALNNDDWKEFVALKIKNLRQKTESPSITSDEKKSLNIEIEIYEYRLKYDIPFNDDIFNDYISNWRSKQYLLESCLKSNKSDSIYNKTIKNCKLNVALNKYALENKINYDISDSAITVLSHNKVDARISLIRSFKHFDIVIVAIAIYIACTSIAEEKNKGTIKNLLTKPHKRSQILISKILACVITIIITTLFMILVQYIVGGIIFGFDSYSIGYIGYNYTSNSVFTLNLFVYLLLLLLCKLPMYFIIVTFCIFMSVMNNHSVMTMILTLIIFFICSTVIAQWSEISALTPIAKYFITNNWDFSIYLFGRIPDINVLTLPFSVCICLIYEIALLGIAIRHFAKKDIYNI